MSNYFHETLVIIQHIISLCGVIIILSGVLKALFDYLKLNLRANVLFDQSISDIRLRLARVLVLGLEFIIASDLIGTTTAPDFYSVGILAGIVLIRTFLSYTLSRDLKA